MLHIQNKKPSFKYPSIIQTVSGKNSFSFIDAAHYTRNVRLLEWVPGRLWSAVNPQLDNLRYSLGEVCGEISSLLQDFNHPKASRIFDWDIAQASWTYNHINLFSKEEKECLEFYTKKFEEIQPQYKNFRKSVVHNDANDNNIIVSNDLVNPVVETVIDYGDAAYTQTINDLAVAVAYAIMDHADPLSAALPIVSGYHKKFPLLEKELEVLYILIAIRLVLSVTKSAINKEKEPGNIYLQISDKQAWSLLNKWKQIHPALAHYTFRNACELTPVSHEKLFKDWVKANSFSVKDLLPTIRYTQLKQPDLSIGSLFLGNFSSYQNSTDFNYKIIQLQKNNPDTLFAGGYLESRPVYSTKAFKIEGNNGPEYRTYHLGMDFWVKENTPIHAICDAEVFGLINNDMDQDYGPTIILKHSINDKLSFYSLYGHLSKESLVSLKKGKKITKGEKFAETGHSSENGNWPPHLHFQIILDMYGQATNFPGVCSPAQLAVWSSVCPDPSILLKCKELSAASIENKNEIIEDRK